VTDSKRSAAEYGASFDVVVIGAGQAGLAMRRGVTDLPGLYFLGLTWQYTRGSALLGWVKDDAKFIAERIAERTAALDRQAVGV
jgi:hypothetical protein